MSSGWVFNPERVEAMLRLQKLSYKRALFARYPDRAAGFPEATAGVTSDSGSREMRQSIPMAPTATRQ